jgi:hypothetical protein
MAKFTKNAYHKQLRAILDKKPTTQVDGSLLLKKLLERAKAK